MSGVLLQMTLEGAKTVVPESSVLLDPGLGFLHPLLLQTAAALAPVLLPGQQAGLLQESHVLADRGRAPMAV